LYQPQNYTNPATESLIVHSYTHKSVISDSCHLVRPILGEFQKERSFVNHLLASSCLYLKLQDWMGLILLADFDLCLVWFIRATLFKALSEFLHVSFWVQLQILMIFDIWHFCYMIIVMCIFNLFELILRPFSSWIYLMSAWFTTLCIHLDNTGNIHKWHMLFNATPKGAFVHSF
jgi:hypothetical protein